MRSIFMTLAPIPKCSSLRIRRTNLSQVLPTVNIRPIPSLRCSEPRSALRGASRFERHRPSFLSRRDWCCGSPRTGRRILAVWDEIQWRVDQQTVVNTDRGVARPMPEALSQNYLDPAHVSLSET